MGEPEPFRKVCIPKIRYRSFHEPSKGVKGYLSTPLINIFLMTFKTIQELVDGTTPRNEYYWYVSNGWFRSSTVRYSMIWAVAVLGLISLVNHDD
jgi:hypothetical protein